MSLIKRASDRVTQMFNISARVETRAKELATEIVEQQTEEILSKAINDPVHTKLKALQHNPWFHMYSGMGYYDKPSRVTFQMLQLMADNCPVVSAVINTRINQVSSFSKQSDIAEKTQNKPLGFKIVHKLKPVNKMTKGEKKYAQELEDVITNCGYTDRFVTNRKRDRFRTFLRATTRDRLTFDQVTFELISNRKKEIAEFWAVDASTIRICSPEQRDKGVDFLQVIDQMVMAEFTHKDLAFCVSNPRTDIKIQGYGFSELEQMVKVVTSQIYTDAYNQKFFSQGLGVQGILNLKTKDGKIPEDVMEAFKVQLQAQAAGVRNAWKTPVTNADEIQFINLKPSNRDMEFKVWMEYLIKIACAIYQIDPSEINFHMSGSSSTRTNFESGAEQKVKYSKDKGLKPLLEFVSDNVNEHIIESYTEDFIFHFAGLDSRDEKEVVSIRSQEVGAYKTVDEVRQEAGLEPLGEEKGGELILNPQFVQAQQNKQMNAQQEEMGGEAEESGFPEESEEGEEPEGSIEA